MRTYDEVWRFETPRFAIVGEVTECCEDPADDFDDEETVEAIRNGTYAWFDARVRVILLETGETLGADYLGHCCYSDPAELFRPLTSGYAASLVSEAIADARTHVTKLAKLGLREVA